MDIPPSIFPTVPRVCAMHMLHMLEGNLALCIVAGSVYCIRLFCLSQILQAPVNP